MRRFRSPPDPGRTQTDSMDALPVGDSGPVLAQRVPPDRVSDECPREPSIPYANLLALTLLATVPGVFLAAWLVATLFGAYVLIFEQGYAAMPEVLWMPLLALWIAGIAFLFGILPALLICAPLWALLQRLGVGGYIAFAVVGSLPAVGLLAVDGSSLGSLFLIFGVPASLLVRVFVALSASSRERALASTRRECAR